MSQKNLQDLPMRWWVRSSVSALVGGLFLVQMSLLEVHLISGIPHLALRHLHWHFLTMLVFATGMFIAALVLGERNSRLLQRNLRMTRLMLRINQELRADGPLDARLSRILQELVTLPQLALQQKAGVFLRSQDEDNRPHWTLTVTYGEFLTEFQQHGAVLASVCDQVAASQQVQVSDICIFDPHHEHCCKNTLNGNYIVPLVHQGQVEGVMFLFTAPTPGRDAHLLRLLDVVGATLGSQIAEERAREQSARLATRLNTTLESITDAFFTLDRAWRFTYINKEAERLFRRPRAGLLGKVFLEEFEGTVGSPFDREYHRAVAENHAVAFEAFSTTLHLWLDVHAYPSEDGLTVYFRDVTEHKQHMEQLRLAAIAFESQEGILIADAENIILRTNRAFTTITGYTAEEAIGKKTDLLQSDRHDRAFYQAMWEGIQRTGSWQGEIWDKRKDGEVYPAWLSITAVKDSAGKVTHYVDMFTDLTQQKAAEEEIQKLSFYDPLTRLPNRRSLLDRLQRARETCLRSHHHGALLFLGLDNFKLLNNALGHGEGELLLQQVAQRLVSCVIASDTVACLRGDEFAVLLEGLSKNQEEAAVQVKRVSEKIFAALERPYLLADAERTIPSLTASIGAILFQEQTGASEGLLNRADIAMHQARAAGHNLLRFFDPETQAAIALRAAMEADLREGLRLKEFLLYYQPMVDSTGRVLGAEALVRWQQPRRGLVPPDEFIPLAEETGLILPLGDWVLETACAQLVAWSANPETAHLCLAVNVSARQFLQADFVEMVFRVLDHTGASPQKLGLELTESMLLGDMGDITSKMKALKARGVRFSLDDFGTGYSSLSYLKRLPLDQLKIDRSFVHDVLTDPNDRTIVRTILVLAKSLGLEVIAEGVETEEQREFLRRHGCQAFQGHLFSRPLPIDQFDRSLLEKKDIEATEARA
ncbi:MAG: bifunctional diguanylate cyclase/phosphodiesterase [Acidobacteriaceae bacterium]